MSKFYLSSQVVVVLLVTMQHVSTAGYSQVSIKVSLFLLDYGRAAEGPERVGVGGPVYGKQGTSGGKTSSVGCE